MWEALNDDLRLVFLMHPVTQVVIFASLGYLVGRAIRAIVGPSRRDDYDDRPARGRIPNREERPWE
jgi:hypothetical protein